VPGRPLTCFGDGPAQEEYRLGVDASRLLDVDDDIDLVEYCYEQGWTDGLPVVPPTPEKVAAMVAACGRPADDVVCHYIERQRDVTVEQIAVNAVMAGCKAEYLPVVLAIIEAMATDAFGLHAANATTGGSAVGFVVNGPIRTALGMNYRGNVLGPGNRANSTIGRAVRLTQINAFGSVPGAGNEALVGPAGRPILDRASVGQPAKYACYHLVENEEDYPTLRPLHVERGHAPDQSVVTVFATVGHMQLSIHHESTAQEIVDTICHYLVGTGRFGRTGFCALVIPPENADIFVRDGWTKSDIRNAVYSGTSRSVAWVKEHGESLTGGLMDRRGAPVEPGDDQQMVAIAGTPDDILVVVAGGPAGAFVHALLPYGGMAECVIRLPEEDS
jgi:hypothetical protein